MDDPRTILKAAGAECAEVEAWADDVFTGEFSAMQTVPEALSIIGPLREVVVTSNAAILALARLVAELQHRLDDRTERVKQAIERSRVTGVSPQDVLDLIERVAKLQDDEKRDAYLAAKYKWLAEHDIQLVPKDDWHTPGVPDQRGGFVVERRTGFVLTRLQRLWEERHEDLDA